MCATDLHLPSSACSLDTQGEGTETDDDNYRTEDVISNDKLRQMLLYSLVLLFYI